MKYNQIIGFVLLFGIFVAFAFLQGGKDDKQPETAQKQTARANNPQKTQAAAALNDSTKAAAAATVNNTTDTATTANNGVNDSLAAGFSFEKNGEFFAAMEGKNENYSVETDLLKVKFTSKGASIKQIELKNFKTWDGKPLVMFYNEHNDFDLKFQCNKAVASTSLLYFTPVKGISAPVTKMSGDSLKVVFRAPATNADKKEIGAVLFTYTFHKGSYNFGYKVSFEKRANFLAAGSSYMPISWKADISSKEKSHDNERSASTVFYADMDLETDYLSETSDDEEKIENSLKWVSFKQQFFSTTLIAADQLSSAKIESYTNTSINRNYLKTMSAEMSVRLASDKDSVIAFTYYSGPLKYKTLRQQDLSLERQIPLGWSFAPLAWINRFAVIPVFNWLEGYNLNYGIIILILTILLKLVLFPIAMKTYKSSAKMRILKPEVDEINAKFPKKEDAMKKQQATMALYKKAGASPLSGCLPMLLQFPILIAMFRFFPASIELRHQSFLWAEDLSSYDSIFDLGFTIPFYGDHVSLFCLLMTISTVIYTRLNEKMMGSTNTMPGMRTMMYLMPIMFLGFFNSYSSGLSYYYLLANIITFIQIFAIRYFINEDKVRAQVEEHKRKPVKKSNFAKRLEEAQKAAAAKQRRK